mgnify:CR=1 FL=1
MEYILKNKEKEKSIFSVNNNDKYSINNKKIINFTKISKKKKKIINELFTYKREKDNSIKRKVFNSKRYYIFNVIYNKIFIMINLFMIFFNISSSKQNSDIRYLSSMQKIIITITGPGMRTIFSNDFRYQPSALYINENQINLNEELYYDYFDLKEEENIIEVYYSNPPGGLKNMFKYNYYIKKVDLTNFDNTRILEMNSMFSNCIGLEYVNMTGIDTSFALNMDSMFRNCTKLSSLDLSSFNTSSVVDMKCMFCHCTNLKYLNISNFNISLVYEMSEMFSSCESLESIDISSFYSTMRIWMSKMFYNCTKLKSIKFPEKNKILGMNMEYLFQNCYSLTSLNLSCFDTSEVIAFNNMFENCINLISIDISNFNTSRVNTMEYMFKGCIKLEFLDLSHFDTKSLIFMEGMFQNCSSLIYLNLKSVKINNLINTNNIFSCRSDKLILCCEKEYESKLTEDLALINNCSDICFSETKKIITELRKCIIDCNTDNNEYKYKYNNNCYKECPNGTTSSTNDQFLCIKNECVYSNIDKTECFENLPEGYYINNKEEKIIDKCHEKCKTCEQKGDETNNNCKTCKNGYIFEEGNCVKCKYNSYIDDNGNNVCTCSSNIKCKECSEESLAEGKCISCNNEGGYYADYLEAIFSEFYNCYQNITGYYLDDNKFVSCFIACRTCSKGGDDVNHNCDECLSVYTFLNEKDKNGNCYLKCEYYYYFDKFNQYKCTDNNECPSSHSKLIHEKRKCIDECINDDTYKYEYNNQCYKKYPTNQISTNIVEEDTITQKILDKTDYEKITEELAPQVIQNTEKQTIETIPANETQNITEEVTLHITQKEERQYTEEFSATKTQKITEELSSQISYKSENLYTKTSFSIISDIQKLTEEISFQTSQKTESQTTTQNNIQALSDIQNVGNNWNSENFFKGLTEEKNLNISKDDIISFIKEDIINHKMEYLLSNVTEGNKEDIFIKDENVLYQITTTDNQNNNIYNNISSIKLGECENILKGIYGIDENLPLIILKIDYYLEGLLIPIIGYEVYDPVNKTKLNLSYCNKTSISYNIPVSIDENNLFKYDQNSEYYNDECNTYTTEDGTDILINDRKEEFIKNNMSLCENICTYTGYDPNTKKALCECGIKYQEFVLSEIEKQTNLLSNNLTTDDSSNTNLATMKCYETLFSKDGLLTNIGNYILLFIIFLHMVSIILFYKFGYYILENKIKNIISEIQRSKSTKLKNVKIKKKKKKNIYKISNPSKKVKKNIKNRIDSKKKNDQSTNMISKLKLKDNKLNKYNEKEKNGSFIPLSKISNKYIKLNSKLKKNKNINNYNDFEFNSLNYKDALEIDRRTYSQYYISLLRTKQQIIFTFFPIKDNNVLIIKICLFSLSFSIYYFFNTFFFSYNAIHQVYEDKGSYNVSYFMPLIIISFITSYYINIFIKFITLSERNIAEIKKEKIKNLFDKQTKVKRCLIIKYICYFVSSFIFLLFFWYYLSSFCAVYQNSQVFVIKNTFISFIIGLIYPFFVSLFSGIFRLYSLNSKNKECIYKFSQILQFFYLFYYIKIGC